MQHALTAARLREATSLKDEGNARYKGKLCRLAIDILHALCSVELSFQFSLLPAEGNLYAAYQHYQKARELLLTTPGLALDLTDAKNWETAVAARLVLAAVCGNMATVCSGIDHGATIQVIPPHQEQFIFPPFQERTER